jgi:hypothetical protein
MSQPNFHKVVYVNDWLDWRISDLEDDAKLQIGVGIYYHYELQLLIVIKKEVREWSDVIHYLPN